MNRREFLRAAAGVASATALHATWASDAGEGQIVTVSGAIPASQLGTTLPHEHVLVDFIGADRVSPDRYQPDEVVEVVLPYLKRVRELGCQTLFECTPAYLGRDPKLLKGLSEASGVTLVTNTGYYGAVKGKYLPGHVLSETTDQLAARWLAEWRDGIDGTGIRPGFIKIGVDAGPLAEVNHKLVVAAARTHRGSGLTIAAHTGDGVAALEELQVLKTEGVAPDAWIWVHAQSENDMQLHVQAAREGAWVEFDGVSPDSIDQHVKLVGNMRRHGLLHRVLISHDAGWYAVGEPSGGKFRPYDTLFTQFPPALRKAGFNEMEIQRLTTSNAAEAFQVRVRVR